MTDNDAIAAILKSGKEIPVLNLGVDHTAIVESVFPVRERIITANEMKRINRLTNFTKYHPQRHNEPVLALCQLI